MKLSRFARLAAAALAALAQVALAYVALTGQAAHAEPVPLRFGVIPVLGAGPVFVAEHEGLFKEAGLAPTFTTFESGPHAIQAAASGTIDVYVAGVVPVAIGRTRGLTLKVVAATAVGENALVAGPKLAAYFKPGVAAADAFKAFRAENGRPVKIATQPPGSIPSTNLLYWLQQAARIDKNDYEIASLGIDAAQQAILAGAVDATTIREPALTIVQERNPDIKLIASGNDLFPGQPGTVVAVTESLIAKNPKAVEAIVGAVARGVDLLKRDPAGAAPAIEAAIGKGIVSTATIAKALASPGSAFVADPRTIVASTKAMLDYQVVLGTLEKAPPLEGLFDLTFYEAATKR